MKILMYIRSNDVKWMEREEDLPFVPQVGTDFEGISSEQPLRISGLSYNIQEQFIKVRLAWLSAEPMDSSEMVKLGWKIKM
jgi:hypothetical protein